MGHLIQDFFLIFRIKNLLKAFSNSPCLDLNLISKSPKRFEKTYFLGRLSGLKFDSLINFILTCIEMLTTKIQKKHAFYIFVNLTFSKKHAEILCALFMCLYKLWQIMFGELKSRIRKFELERNLRLPIKFSKYLFINKDQNKFYLKIQFIFCQIMQKFFIMVFVW